MNEYMGYLLSDFVEPNNFVKWKATPYNFVLSTSEIEEKNENDGRKTARTSCIARVC